MAFYNANMTETHILDTTVVLIENLLKTAGKTYDKTDLRHAVLVDLPLDSFDLLELVMSLEEVLHVKVSTDMIFEAETVSGLARHLSGLFEQPVQVRL